MSLDSTIDEPEWPEILRAVQDQLARRIHTSLPAIVKSYNSATQTATVELAVQLDGLTVPPLADVPVCWPGDLHAPPAAGASVMVLFAEEDFAKWYDTGSVSAPAVLARHGLHAVAVPGLHRADAALPVTGGHTTLVANDLRLGSDGATDPVALEPGVADVLNDFIVATKTVIAAAVDPTGIPTAAKAAFAAAASAVQSRLAAGDMAATKVKAV